MITSRNKGANFPSDPSIDFDRHLNASTSLVCAQWFANKRSYWNASTWYKWWPNIHALVPLIGRRYVSVVSDLLATIGGINIEFVIVYAYIVVGISRWDGDLEVRSEEVRRGGDFEVINCGILDDETGLFGL